MGGNVVCFWHYTKSAAGSRRMRKSIHRPLYRNLPSGKKTNRRGHVSIFDGMEVQEIQQAVSCEATTV